MNPFLMQKFVSHLVIEVIIAGGLIWKTAIGEIAVMSLNFWALVAVLGSLIIITTALIIHTRRKLKSLADQQ